MKPLMRWTIGECCKEGLEILEYSITKMIELYGDRFDYRLCFNTIDPISLNPLIPLVQQLPIEGMYAPSGVAWKLYPPRLSPNSHEIFIDNDLILLKKLDEIEEFLEAEDKFVFTEALFYNHGRFKCNLKLNSGLIGIPPKFDFKNALMPFMADQMGWIDKFDEQGMVSTIFSTKKRINIPLSKIAICHEGNFRDGTHGYHFVTANKGFTKAWNHFKTTR